MRPRSLVLLSILVAIACPSFASATSPVQIIEPDTTYDEPPRPVEQIHPPWWGEDEGFVPVTVRIDTTGHVVDAYLEHFFEEPIGSAAVDAARAWTFTPARKRGRPVEIPWFIEVEMNHPRSGELVLPEDTLSVAVWSGLSGEGEEVALRASATYDSVTATYRYRYEVRNRCANDARVTAFALLGATREVFHYPDPRFTPWITPEWKGGWHLFTDCAGRSDMLAWGIWYSDPRTGSSFEAALGPGSAFEPATFRSKRPPGRVRWAARTAVDPFGGSSRVPCGQDGTTWWEELPLQGTTVGPVATE